MNSLPSKELVYKRSHLLPFGEEHQVSPVEDVKPGVGDQAQHDPGIDRRDDWVIVAGQNQRGLREPMQPGQAGPARACQ